MSREMAVLVYLLLFEMLVLSRTVGVTHWKLQENSIVPASATPLPGAAEESGEDPEFAVLIKRTTGSSGAHHGGLRISAGEATSAGAKISTRESCSHPHQHDALCPPGAKKNVESQPPVLSTEQCSDGPPAPRNPDGTGPMLVQCRDKVHSSSVYPQLNTGSNSKFPTPIAPLYSTVLLIYIINDVGPKNRKLTHTLTHTHTHSHTLI